MNPSELAGLNPFASPYYDASPHPESPKPPFADWRGVLIDAPQQAILNPKQPMIIVRGTYSISGDKYPKNDRLQLVAIDLASKKEYKGTAGQHDPSLVDPPPPSEPPNAEIEKRMIFSGFFNTDLVATVHLPVVPASYRVRAELGDIRSNEINVQVIGR